MVKCSFRSNFVSHVICITALLMSTFLLEACGQQPTKSPKKVAEIVQTDSLLQSLLGDSVCLNVFITSNRVRCYKLTTKQPHDDDKTIGGYKVTSDCGPISKNDANILRFLLSDSKSYMMGVDLPSVPFIPELAVEFVSKKNKVDFVFSFAGGQYSIVFNGVTIKTVKYTNERLILLYFQRLLDDKELADMLNVR